MYIGIMPRASKRTFNKEIATELKANFASLISSLQYLTDIEQFFNDFLTKEEKLMLSKRLMLHLLLESKYKDFEIQSILGISRETVRIHKQNWEKGGPIYKKIINKISRGRKIKLFFKALDKKLKPLELALISKTDMKARAKFLSGDYNDD
ncbi:MAG: hypothetical protein COU25_02915 [Candidatus Levybacteria bacterium CG10_big_fil_rev_8_21_14_0_10_35_13]|nr:MAG: hypothetical protein COU25_02915 [Candidatus Levybacteria bacterium CG10_big_fil_rev_8_21_14_0_10_35_13]